MSDINKYLSEGVELEKSADDILSYIIGNYSPDLPQKIVDGVNRWCIDNKMRLNTTKCKVLSIRPKDSTPPPIVMLNNSALEEVDTYKYLGVNLTNTLNWDAQWYRVYEITRNFPYLLSQLKKSGFRESILINVYRSYALSHFIYSAPILTSVSEKAKLEISRFHNKALRIININPEVALAKYNINTIDKLIDTTCANLLIRIISEPTHPVTASLTINPRSTSIRNKFRTNLARTDLYNNSFVQKYLRYIRDGSTNMYQPKSSKFYSSQSKLLKKLTKSKRLAKTNVESAKCPLCGQIAKIGTGMGVHQRGEKCKRQQKQQ